MGMTITEKILARKAHRSSVAPGDYAICDVDLACVDDIQFPIFRDVFDRLGGEIWDREKAVLIIDHHLPASTIDAAETNRQLREFAAKYRLVNSIFDDGIKHQVFRDRGLVRPGMLLAATDSHTPTCGAFAAVTLALGPTDVAAIFRGGRTWLRIPETIQVDLQGQPLPHVGAKDIALQLLKDHGPDWARYRALEFTGSALPYLNLDARMTLCNMGTEMGAKNAIFEPDQLSIEYAQAAGREYELHPSDPDARYVSAVHLDVQSLEPLVAVPFSPENVVSVREMKGQKVDQVFLGTCTNGNLSDLASAASILRGHKVHPGVRLIVIPASKSILLQATRLGIMGQLIEAGADVCTPNCGPCGGGHMGLLGAGEVMLSTQNRNFRGRAGHIESRVFLSSPDTAAASAIAGEIADPRELA